MPGLVELTRRIDRIYLAKKNLHLIMKLIIIRWRYLLSNEFKNPFDR